ncbi:MAG: hypothetical protein E7168_01710 [Firmicutes bacterium]|nr:hypothetical protein [Bacillota bacterium]
MTLKTRYLFFRKTYPDTLLIFRIKENYMVFDIDYEIGKYLHFKKDVSIFEHYKIDFIVIGNTEILKSSFFEDNQYGKYVYLIRIKRYLDKIISCLLID